MAAAPSAPTWHRHCGDDRKPCAHRDGVPLVHGDGAAPCLFLGRCQAAPSNHQQRQCQLGPIAAGGRGKCGAFDVVVILRRLLRGGVGDGGEGKCACRVRERERERKSARNSSVCLCVAPSTYTSINGLERARTSPLVDNDWEERILLLEEGANFRETA